MFFAFSEEDEETVGCFASCIVTVCFPSTYYISNWGLQKGFEKKGAWTYALVMYLKHRASRWS